MASAAGADQADFFARGPDEGDVAVLQRAAQRPDGGDQRRVADAIVKAAAIGARAEQRAILLRNGDRIADLDAEFRDFLGAARADVHADRLLRFSGPFEILLVPAVGQFHDRVAIARGRVHQHRMALVKAQVHAAERCRLRGGRPSRWISPESRFRPCARRREFSESSFRRALCRQCRIRFPASSVSGFAQCGKKLLTASRTRLFVRLRLTPIRLTSSSRQRARLGEVPDDRRPCPASPCCRRLGTTAGPCAYMIKQRLPGA